MTGRRAQGPSLSTATRVHSRRRRLQEPVAKPRRLPVLLLVLVATAMLLSIRGVAAAAAARRSTSRSILGFVRIPGAPGQLQQQAVRWASSPAAAAGRPRVPRTLSPCAVASTAEAPAEAPQPLLDIYELSEEDLGIFLETRLGQKRYRAKQIRQWLYLRGATSFDEMQDLPKALRASLAEHFRLGSLEVAFEQRSADGTIKRAYRLLKDNTLIESVLMPYEDGRRTACISSQAGCAMACAFCATGQQGFTRQLTDSEIFEQALIFSRDLVKEKGERLSNVVFMGEGEPLNNRIAVKKAIRRLNTDLGIGARHITVSTVGLAPRIRDLADDEESLFGQIKLAVSLHAATDAERSALMPVNKRFNLKELMEAVEYYVQKTNRRITFEYALISGQNDRPPTARELGQLLAPLKGRCHVNVIPVNPTDKFEGRPSDKAAVTRFINILEEDYGIPATVRIRRGIDIDGGCGQLKGKLAAMEMLKQKEQQEQGAAAAAAVDA